MNKSSRILGSGGLLLVIAYLGFISLGLPDPVAGVAWPSVREAFDLPQSSFGLVFVALGVGYCASGFFGGTLTNALGVGNLLWISSGLVAVAMLGSGLAPSWPLFVGCAAIWGLGSGGIDAGLNSYGSRHFSPRHMNWLHACYSLGATLGPLLVTAVLAGTQSWRTGYLSIGTLLLGMAIVFLVTRDRWNDPANERSTTAEDPQISSIRVWTALKHSLVWIQIAVFFLYVGVEFTVGQWTFTLLTESRHFSEETAGVLAAGYYGAIGVGRVTAGLIAHRLGLDTIVRAAMFLAFVGAVLFTWGPGVVANLGLACIGLGLAPVFPCLMTMTPARLGADYATHAVGFQVSAGMLGAASVPGLAGLLAQRYGLEIVPEFCIVLTLFLLLTHEALILLSRRR